MVSLGIDFGTTNSLIAYYERGEARPFTSLQSNNSPSIPSSVVVGSDGTSTIGRAARLLRRSKGVTFAEGFKMMLGRESEALAAKAFLARLIEMFRQERNHETLDHVVITVPETWKRGEGQTQYAAFRDICKSLKLPIRKILSEPVAAASYFAHLNTRAQQPFKGQLLVYDHGGGTLDLALLDVDGETLTVRDGGGISGALEGVGGTYYDRYIAEALAAQNDEWRRIIEADRTAWLEEFERNKIDLSLQIADALNAYKTIAGRSEDFDLDIMTVLGVPIRPSVLINVFEQCIEPRVRKAIEAMLTTNAETTDTTNPEQFRILPVGGFSNFPLVDDLLADIFDRNGKGDRRFDTCMPLADRSLAIAKGACLFAAERTDIVETCPIGISIMLADRSGSLQPVTLLKRGEWISDLNTVRFAPIYIEVGGDKGTKSKDFLEFIIEGNTGSSQRYSDIPVSQVLPNYRYADRWRVGARVDDSLIVRLVFCTDDENAFRKEITLGTLIDLSQAKGPS